MAELLKQQDHQQADETFGRVINDGRPAGSTVKSNLNGAVFPI
jgi:transposase